MKVIYKFLLFFYLMAGTLHAQIADTSAVHMHNIPVDSLIKMAETRYNVRFFYDQEWIKNKEINPEIIELSLDEFASAVSKETRLSLTKLNQIYYVFTPLTEFDQVNLDAGRYLVVGDRLYYGSKTSALVKGKVIDSQSKQPIPRALVSIVDLDKQIIADQNGKFTSTIQVGEHELKVSFPGFDDNIKILHVLSDGAVTIEMFEKSISLDEIVVLANGSERNFRRSEMSVLKIDSKGIKELPVTIGETDVLKSLSLMPGIQTSGDFGTGFNVRGGSTDQNLVLVEDVPLFNTSHLFGLTSVLNSDGINSMTIYKGGIPVIYGERASSVLNIRMGSKNLAKTSVKGGIGIINSRINLEIPISPKLYILLGGRISYSDWMLNKMPDADLMNSSASFYDLNFYSSYTINESNKISFFVYQSNDDFGYAGNQKFKYGNFLGSFRLTHWFNSSLYMNFIVGFSRYNSSLTESDTTNLEEAYKLETYLLYRNFKCNLVWETNSSHVFTLGFNGFLYDIQPGNLNPLGAKSTVPVKNVQNEYGFEGAAYLSDDYKISEKLSVEAGLRYSFFNYLGPKMTWVYDESMPRSQSSIIDSVLFNNNDKIQFWSGFEPRISLRYNINFNNSIRMSYNRINQYINLVSNTAVISPSDLWKLSDNYVRPLVCDQFAIGYFQNSRDLAYESSLELYYKPYTNALEYENGAQILLNDYIEADLLNAKGRNYGFEVYLKKNNGKLTGWISYTFSRSLRKTTSEFPEEKVNGNNWFPATLDRPHNLIINWGYYINKRWRFASTFTYNSGRPVSLPELNYNFKGYQVVYYSDRGKYRLPDYHRLDISISRYESLKIKKSWKSFWTFSIVNIYARKNAYSAFYEKERSQFTLNGSKYSLYKMYIIGKPFPTFTYNFIF